MLDADGDERSAEITIPILKVAFMLASAADLRSAICLFRASICALSLLNSSPMALSSVPASFVDRVGNPAQHGDFSENDLRLIRRLRLRLFRGALDLVRRGLDALAGGRSESAAALGHGHRRVLLRLTSNKHPPAIASTASTTIISAIFLTAVPPLTFPLKASYNAAAAAPAIVPRIPRVPTA